MKVKKILKALTLEDKDLYYKLSIVFAFFFIVPVLAFLYFAVKYNILADKFAPLLALALLVAALFGYVIIRRIFDDIRLTSQSMSEAISREIKGLGPVEATSELKGIVQSFHAFEKELHESFRNLEKRVSQISTLKELSDLCYVTFDTEDLSYITLERALRLVNADIGSIMILEQPKRDAFIIQANIGLSEALHKGDRIDFGESIAKYAVVNKSPLLVEDIEHDIRFRRPNNERYGSKSFLCMPLKGIKEVIGVLTLSRRDSDTPFTQDDVEVLTPLLSGATFSYDNLVLMKKNDEKDQHLKVFDYMQSILNSSLRGGELLQAILKQIQSDIPFDMAMILLENENNPGNLSLIDFFGERPTDLSWQADYPYAGTVIDLVIKQGTSLLIDDTNTLKQPVEQMLFMNQNLHSCLLSPLKTDGVVKGVLAVGTMRPHVLTGVQERVERFANLLALALEMEQMSALAVKRDQDMAMIKQIGSLLAASTFDMKAVLGHTMDLIQATLDVEAGSLLLLEKDELIFNVGFCADSRVDMELLNNLRIKLGQGISGYCAARGEPMMVRNVLEAKQFSPDFDRRTGFTTRSVLCVPLIYLGKVIGVIEVINKKKGDFNNDDLRLLHSISTSVSIAMENARLYQETLSMAEQEHGIRNMFQKFVPKEIVDKITKDINGEKLVINELKTLTLMNIDIRVFSRLSQTLGPQKTVAMLNHFFSIMGEIVFDHHGIVDKYLGDGFLAIFGAPVSDIDDAAHAVSAALEMKAAMGPINEHFAGELDTPLTIGISIHTGEAVVGNIGFEKKMDYTVIGDSVNAVFRLQDMCHVLPNGILISEKTLRAVSASHLNVKEMGIYEAGGILGPLKVYELLGWQS